MSFIKGHIAWNRGLSSWSKGLTKETDVRIAKASEKISASLKGCVTWNKGLTKETDSRVARIYDERIVWNKGLTKDLDSRIKSWNKGLAKETDSRVAKNAENNIGRHQYTLETRDLLRNAAIKQWQNPNMREMILSKVLKANASRPNKTETELENILDKDFRYTGDGSFFIGGKIPDFVNVNGKKQIIELLGCYWHGCPEHYPDEEKQREFEQRVQLFKSFGYQTLGIWEHELKDQETVKRKILEFSS